MEDIGNPFPGAKYVGTYLGVPWYTHESVEEGKILIMTDPLILRKHSEPIIVNGDGNDL